MTSYLAVVGPRTAWPGERGRTLLEMTDGSVQFIPPVSPELAESLLNIDDAVSVWDELSDAGPRERFHRANYGNWILLGLFLLLLLFPLPWVPLPRTVF